MKHLIFLTACCVGPALTSQAQSNFRPGYVVQLSGDTLRGDVDVRSEQRNARICRFKTGAGEATEYTPSQLRGYGVAGGATYQAISARLLKGGISESDTATVAGSAFAEVLVSGRASLLYVYDRSEAQRYYLRLADGPARELVQHTQLITVGGRNLTQKTQEYRRTLTAAMADCPAVQPVLAELPLAHTPLIKVVRQYNECIGSQTSVSATAVRRNKVKLVLVGGMQQSKLIYKAPNDQYTDAARLQPMGGLGLQMQLAGLNRHLSVRVEALFENQRYQSTRTITRQTAPDEYQEFRTHIVGVQIPVMARYTLLKGVVRPFVQAGGGVHLLPTIEAEVRSRYSISTAYSAWTPIVPEAQKYEIGYIGGVGLTTARTDKRNVALEFRYEGSNGFSDYSGLDISQTRWWVLLSYDLTK